MGIGVINNNVAAINSLRTLQRTGHRVDKSLQRLSSGLRINSAADDAAGLAVSEKMRAQLQSLHQANRNAQDGISMLQTAEGVLETVHTVLQRMRVLAVQAANDTYTSYDRRRIQEEFDQLMGEIDRVGAYTQFNTKNLLDGSTLGNANTQDARVLTASVVGRVVDADYSITVLSAGRACNVHGNINIQDGPDPDRIPNLRDLGVVGTEELHIVVNGQTTIIDLHEDDMLSDVAHKINLSGAQVRAGLDAEGNDITMTSMRSGPKYNISFGDDPDGMALKLGFHGGSEGTLSSSIDALDSSGNSTGRRVFTSGTCTIISITNITQQSMFITNPGETSIPGGFGRSLGVFISTSTVFTDRELSRPINSFDGTPIGGVNTTPLWPTVRPAGSPFTDQVDLSQSLLLMGLTIHIDEDLDYGHLDVHDPYGWISAWPDPHATLQDGTAAPGDPFAHDVSIVYVKAATPQGQTLGASPDLMPGDPTIRGDTTSLWSTRLSVRDMRQKFHIGANQNQNMIVEFANITAEGMGLSWHYRSGGAVHDGHNRLPNGSVSNDYRQRLSVQTQANADHAIGVLDKALTVVSQTRSRLGAYMSGLENVMQHLSISTENQTAAESRIRDVDMAAEMTEFTKNQILIQSGAAMLAQANHKPHTILQLLG